MVAIEANLKEGMRLPTDEMKSTKIFSDREPFYPRRTYGPSLERTSYPLIIPSRWNNMEYMSSKIRQEPILSFKKKMVE